MTSQEEKSPLLDNFQPNSIDLRDPRDKVRDLYRRHHKLASNGDYFDDSRNISVSESTSSLNLIEADHIVAVFVVAFDTKAGNIIEWCKPEEADLEGIEFKAMASGSHTLRKDFVYFRKGHHFGLACFENMPVESDIERGARMKSVGVLATSYTLLYRHMQFLEIQVRHQLETPGRYTQLKAFFNDKRATVPSSLSLDSMPRPGSSLSVTSTSDLLPELKITHPAGCFSQFIKFFAEHIFTLWKYALLQKRVLFFSPPPIGVVCYRVYCACALANHNIIDLHLGQELQPHFYVNVADIEMLETEVSYIACTTEKIFESKTHLYDVYVDNQNITANTQNLRDLLKVSDADKDKYAKLNNQRSAHLFSAEELGEETNIDEEDLFTTFFTELNNRLLSTLLDVSSSQDRQITSDHMRNMGLDPIGDRPFLMELVELYGIDVMLMVDNPCCPRSMKQKRRYDYHVSPNRILWEQELFLTLREDFSETNFGISMRMA